MQEIDWSPLWLSLKTGAAAALLAFFLGIWMAGWSMKRKGFGRAVLEGILTLPFVLPPAVTGFLLLCLFSVQTGTDGLSVVIEPELIQSWKGWLVAFFVIAFPLMYRNARVAFEQINENLLYAGRTLGMSEGMLFVKVILPSAGREIFFGGVLAFLRAVGEYGATAMLVQSILGEMGTLPLADGRLGIVGVWSAGCVVGILLLLIVFHVMRGRGMKARRWI